MAAKKLRTSPLRQALIDQRLFQTELVAATGISRAALSRYVNGDASPSPERKRAIASYLKRPINQLFPKK